MNKKAIVAELMMSKPSGKGCRYCGHKVRHLARCLCADSCGNDNFPRYCPSCGCPKAMPINTFNIGDKVKIKGINAQWSWQKGVIYKIENTVIIVKLDSGKNLNFNANELESII